MRPFRLLVSMAWAAGLLLSALAASGPAAAGTQGRPSWSSGDFWQYATIAPDVGYTTRVTVEEATSVGPYPAFRVTVSTWQNHTLAVRQNYTLWIRDSDLGIAKEEWEAAPGDVRTLTFDPPMASAEFPLEFSSHGISDTWVGTTTVTETPNLDPSNGSSYELAYDGMVAWEGAVTVPAGTFHASAVRTTPAFEPEMVPGGTAVSYYSEGVGFHVTMAVESQDGAILSSSVLTAYRYAAPGRTALIVAGFVGGVFAAVAVAGILLWRRSRRRPASAKDRE